MAKNFISTEAMDASAADLNRSDRVVMVANHRSFFDYFTVMHVIF
jgi:hypothetical protein